MSERSRRSGFRPGRRPLTCYHEAGHCLVRWYFGHFFDRALVLTVEEVQRGVRPMNRRGLPVLDVEGMVDGYDLGPSPAFSPQVLDGMGGEPEVLARFRRSTQIAVEMELMNCSAGIVAEARYRKYSAGAAALMGGSSDMKQLRAVLATWFPDPALCRTASILAERRAAALIRSRPGWAAITALAGALLERGELSGEEADPLFIAAYGHERPSLRAWHDAWPPSLEMIRAGQVPGLEVT